MIQQHWLSLPLRTKRPTWLPILLLVALHGSLEAQFVRERSIDLAALYGPDSGHGTFPTALDFDGTRAFLAGFNGEDEPKGISVLILSGLRDGETIEVVSSVQSIVPAFTGFADVTYLPGTDSAYVSWVGGPGAFALLRIDAGTGAPVAEFGTSGFLLGPSAKLPLPIYTLAPDPGFPAEAPASPFPALSGLTLGDPQRFAFDPATGALLYGPPPGPAAGMPVSVGTAPELRDHVYDPATGDVWVREGNGVTRSARSGENSVAANEAGAGWFANLLTSGSARGRRIGFVPVGFRLDTQPWLLVNDLPGDGTGGDRLYIVRADGSTAGLPQAFLDGSEDGGAPWGVEAGALSAAAALDPAGSGDTLLVVLASETRRLDLYRGVPSVPPEWQPVPVLAITPDGAGGLLITWEPGPGPFTVEAADSPSGPFVAIATGLTGSQYSVSPADASHLFYRVFTGEEAGPAEPPEFTSIRPVAGGIELVWTPATGLFDVGRAATPEGPFALLIAGLTTGMYTDPNPLAGTAFYQVINRGAGGGEPEPPELTSIRPVAGGIELVWTPATGLFDVERGAAPQGPFTTLAAGLTTSTYTDAAPPPGAAFYRIINRGGAGGEPAPVPITAFGLSPSGRVVLHWAGETGARYRVERAPAPGGPYEIAADALQGESWEDPLSDSTRRSYYRLWRLP